MGTKMVPNYANLFVFVEKQTNFVNDFHPALQFTWEIIEISVSFLVVLVPIRGNAAFVVKTQI